MRKQIEYILEGFRSFTNVLRFISKPKRAKGADDVVRIVRCDLEFNTLMMSIDPTWVPLSYDAKAELKMIVCGWYCGYLSGIGKIKEVKHFISLMKK